MAVNERLFREELDYLRRYGKLMARENPRLERSLATQGTDPGVERLLEGFSLLSARLREKIGDDYPELTVPLITRLWPGYLRPIPAITVIEYTPDSSRLTTPVMISRGEQVMNRVQDSQPEDARPGGEGPTARLRVSLHSAGISGCCRCVRRRYKTTAACRQASWI